VSSVDGVVGAEPPLLEVAELTVRRERGLLLDKVSFDVAPGSLHALVGPNGAGKSTLITAILGRIMFEGSIRARWRAGARIGYLPQSFEVDRSLPITVADFLAMSRQRRPVCLGLSPATRRKVSALLATVGLGGLEGRPLGALSGGELQRVLLCHAMDPLPELLLLDEPASGLDADANARLEELLRGLRGRVTVLMVAHDLEQVRRLADRVTVLQQRVVRDGPPEQALDGVEAALWPKGAS
jgi:zinc transport system ATP-binding protein